jgi:signal transduction histidine kinase
MKSKLNDETFGKKTGEKNFTLFLYCLTIMTNIFFVFHKLYSEVYFTIWVNIAFACGSLVSYLIAAVYKRYLMANIIFLAMAHLSIYFAAISGPSAITTGVYFIVLIIMTQLLLDYRYRFVAMVFNVGSLVLCALSISNSLNNTFNKEYENSFVLLNYTFAGLFTALSFIYQNFIQYRSQQRLLKNNIQINKDSYEIKKANAELDKFVYSVSHDIRSPLTSIIGLVNLSKFTNSRQEMQELMQQIDQCANSLLKFTVSILDYSKSNRLVLSNRNIHLKQLISEIQSEQSSIAPDNKVILNTSFEDNLSFCCDYYRLKIVLSNLYSNSIKYCDRYKESSFIKIDAKKIEDFVSITFADNGVGILQERLSNIFNMFYRGTETAKGSGLGLYILKEAIDKMGGAVGVSSQLGEGTIFKIVIPIQAQDSEL